MKSSAPQPWNLLIAGGRLVDPVNGIDARMDLALRDGKIAEVGSHLPVDRAQTVEDVTGKTVVPGLIDVHVHMDESVFGYSMVAQTGVVTAIDFAGRAEIQRQALKNHGAAGLSIGFLKPIIPGQTVSVPAIPEDEQEQFFDSLEEDGALGVKVVGGHYPIEPETFSRLVRRCDERKLFIASHVGTTRKGSNIDGLREAIDLADGHPLYIAHVNSYCRGASGQHPVQEAAWALQWIEASPNLTTENYIATINGCSAACKDGIPVSRVTRNCLEQGGFAPDQAGLEAAIQAGYARVQVAEGDVKVLADPETGLSFWKDPKSISRVSFPVNSVAACCALALARNRSNEFVIDILSTDGGQIPRNTLVKAGLSLVRAGGWSIAEFIQKTAIRPARAFGLDGKGHLGPGADADVTVLDLERGYATLSVSAGCVIMREGRALGGKGRRLLNR